jgi:hypothetical protein
MERSQSEALFSMLEAISKMKNREMTVEIFKLWLVAMEGYPFEEIKSAFNRYIQTEKGMPEPVDIVKILRGSGEDLTLSALIKVEEAMRVHGGYATVVFDDPIIHAVIRQLGGWVRLCSLPEEKFVWWRKDFKERYQHHLRMGLHQEDVPLKLSGIFDEANRPLGVPAQKTVVIGDYEKAIGWTAKLEGNGNDRKVRSLIEKGLENKSFL